MISESVLNDLNREIKDVLEDYNLPSRDKGINKILDEWKKNKGPLIELLSKHPNWNPKKFMISFDSTVSREADREKINVFFEKVYDLRMNGTITWTGTLDRLYGYSEKTITKEIEKLATRDYPDLRITAGQKTSKAVNKILTSIDVPKLFGTYINDRGESKSVYDREYAAYSDALNPLDIVRHTALSVHPVDFLLSSNGNSWSSCHTIDKNNPNGFSGCHCSGTLSYMMDGSTMVFYHVDKSYTGNDLELQPKIDRQLFHYENGVLIQGRLYPQCNDGKNSLYVPIRAIVQDIFAKCLDLPNMWRKKGGTEVCDRYTSSKGTHYKDYTCQSECNVSRIVDMIPEGDDNRIVHIGHDPICPVCGGKHYNEEWLYCGDCKDLCRDGYRCADCGEWVSEEDVVWVNEEPYCPDCVRWCEHCQQYERIGDVHYYESLDMWICDKCIANDYERCNGCGECREICDMIEDAHGDYWCSECAEERLIGIDGEYYPENEVSECPICGQLYVGDECPDCEEEETT